MDNVIKFPQRTIAHQAVIVASLADRDAWLRGYFGANPHRVERWVRTHHDGKTYDEYVVVDSVGRVHSFPFDVTAALAVAAQPLFRPAVRPAGQAAAPSGPSPWTIVGVIAAGFAIYEGAAYLMRSSHGPRDYGRRARYRY